MGTERGTDRGGEVLLCEDVSNEDEKYKARRNQQRMKEMMKDVWRRRRKETEQMGKDNKNIRLISELASICPRDKGKTMCKETFKFAL